MSDACVANGARAGGFTMMEAMIVIAIIAILALLALPNYQDKIVRDQIAEALPLADIVKAPVAQAWASTQSFPADNAAAGLPSADKIVNNFVSSVQVRDGAIDITFGQRAHATIKGKVLTLRPAVVEDAPVVPVTWVCGYNTAPEKMTAKGENKTNVPVGLLPLRCRFG
jgi:type IV pilus assembly protein PilA